MDKHRNEDQRESRLPHLYDITKGQLIVTGATLAASGVVDVLAHNSTVAVVGLIATGIVAHQSNTILDMLVPGRDSAGTIEATERVMNRVAPVVEEYADQSAGAKVRRLLRAKDPELYRTVISVEGDLEEEEPGDLYAGLTPEELAQLRTIEQAEREASSRQRRRMADLVDLAEGLRIHRDDLAGKAIFVCGIRRHGKTTLGARIAEQMGKYHHLPMLIPDLEGDYLSLAEALPRAVIAGAASAAGEYRHVAFEALDTVEAAKQLGYDLLEVGYQVILDMISYDQLDTAVTMQVALIQGMFQWAKEHPDERVPAYVYLDEAQRFLPQTLSESVIKDRKLLGALLDAYMDIIAIGGKRGINPVILTQRFAQVNNKIMAQSEVFFLLRQTHDTDLERCMEYASSPITQKQISLFKPGEGIYISADGTQTVARFRQRESSGTRSRTPQAAAAERYASMPMTRPAARRTGVPAPTIREQEAAVAGQPQEQQLSATIYKLLSLYEEGRISQEMFERLLNAIPAGAASPLEEEPEEESRVARLEEGNKQPLDMELERAINAYREGATSINKLAAAMSIKPYYAGPLLERVKKAIQKRAANE